MLLGMRTLCVPPHSLSWGRAVVVVVVTVAIAAVAALCFVVVVVAEFASSVLFVGRGNTGSCFLCSMFLCLETGNIFLAGMAFP